MGVVEYASNFLVMSKTDLGEGYLAVEDCGQIVEELSGYSLYFNEAKLDELSEKYAKSEEDKKKFLELYGQAPKIIVSAPVKKEGTFTTVLWSYYGHSVEELVKNFIGIEGFAEVEGSSDTAYSHEWEDLFDMSSDEEEEVFITATELIPEVVSVTTNEALVDGAVEGVVIGEATPVQVPAIINSFKATPNPLEATSNSFEATSNEFAATPVEFTNSLVEEPQAEVAVGVETVVEESKVNDVAGEEQSTIVEAGEMPVEVEDSDDSDTVEGNVDAVGSGESVAGGSTELTVDTSKAEGSERETVGPKQVEDSETSVETDKVEGAGKESESAMEHLPSILTGGAYKHLITDEELAKTLANYTSVMNVIPQFKESLLGLAENILKDELAKLTSKNDVSVVSDEEFREVMARFAEVDQSTLNKAFKYSLRRLWKNEEVAVVSKFLDELFFYFEEVADQ